MLKNKLILSLIAASNLAFLSAAPAAGVSTYQVTGPILELNDTMIVVMKGKERFEIARSAATKVTGGELKVGTKVTIYYTMTADSVEVKADKPAKGKVKEMPSPAASPAKKAA